MINADHQFRRHHHHDYYSCYYYLKFEVERKSDRPAAVVVMQKFRQFDCRECCCDSQHSSYCIQHSLRQKSPELLSWTRPRRGKNVSLASREEELRGCGAPHVHRRRLGDYCCHYYYYD